MSKYVLALVLCLATAASSFAQLTVQGRGVVNATPDKATVSFTVSSEDASATVALDSNNVAMKKFMKSLDTLGIQKKDIQTSDFNVGPKYSRIGNTDDYKLVGFTVSNQVTVTVKQFDTLSKLLEQSLRDGVTRVSGVTFGICEPEELANKARKAAVDDARKKADLYAESLGVRITGVKSLSEDNVGGRTYTYRQADYAPASSVPIERGQMSVAVGVTVVYETAPLPSGSKK